MRHRAQATWIVALAMFMKILVPAGFMPATTGTTIVMQMCSGYVMQPVTVTVPNEGQHQVPDHGAKADMPCAFAGLTAPALAAADPVLLALAILFVVAISRHIGPSRQSTTHRYLRPPLRGPPLPS